MILLCAMIYAEMWYESRRLRRPYVRQVKSSPWTNDWTCRSAIIETLICMLKQNKSVYNFSAKPFSVSLTSYFKIKLRKKSLLLLLFRNGWTYDRPFSLTPAGGHGTLCRRTSADSIVCLICLFKINLLKFNSFCYSSKTAADRRVIFVTRLYSCKQRKLVNLR